MPVNPWPFPTAVTQGPPVDPSKVRLNPSQRREFVLVEFVDKEADLWPVSKDMEKRANQIFPAGWMAEVRIEMLGREGHPGAYRIRVVSNYLMTTTAFEMQVLSPATSRPDMGCWVTRAFKVNR